MDSKPYFPKVTASSVEEFNKIESLVRELPQGIIEQISVCEFGLIGVTCHFKRDLVTNSIKIVLPNDVTQITNFGEYIGIHHDKFFFKIPITPNDTHINYIFIKP